MLGLSAAVEEIASEQRRLNESSDFFINDQGDRIVYDKGSMRDQTLHFYFSR